MRRRGSMMIGLALLLVLAMVATVSARVLDQKTLTIRVRVAAMQRLQVIEPVALAVSYPWEGADQGRPLEVRNVGMVRLQSNAPWVLCPTLATDTRFRVSIRPSGDPAARWQVVSGYNPMLSGQMGTYDLSFDVRVEAVGRNLAPTREIIELGFIASQP